MGDKPEVRFGRVAEPDGSTQNAKSVFTCDPPWPAIDSSGLNQQFLFFERFLLYHGEKLGEGWLSVKIPTENRHMNIGYIIAV